MGRMTVLFSFLVSLGTIARLKSFCRRLQRPFSFLTMEPESSQSSDPPPFDPTKPSNPVSFPIQKLEDLHSRSYFSSFHFPFNKASVPLPANSSRPDRPRVLVCHDMAGGYLDDKWVQGGANSDAYAIWHWYLIDVFVYFSHNLVTLPPPCWTNAAHKHGVKILGTFIMEWDKGRIDAGILLSTKESAKMYAERLTELAASLGFDGWLINMEVRLDVEQIPNLKEFVSHLTMTMHASVANSLVIWYDSVTIDGDLGWQNQLNEKNKPFFDLCDGIFVNYTWQEDYPKLSAAVAGDRNLDVYMGIDVFGRGTFGGGKWNTNVALDVLKKDDVSAAIFAPGWVYETKQEPDFQTAQNRWWGLVEKSWGIQQDYPTALPFYSNFDQYDEDVYVMIWNLANMERSNVNSDAIVFLISKSVPNNGHGYHVYADGLQVAARPWNNISSQTFQPVLDGSMDQSTIQVFVNFEDSSYSGGGNITFKGTLGDNSFFQTRLFQGAVPLEDQSIHIIFSVKSAGNSLLGISLKFSNTNGKASILLAPGGSTFLPTHNEINEFSKVITPVEITDPKAGGWIIQSSAINMEGFTLTDIGIVCYNKRRLELHGLALADDGSDKNITPSTLSSNFNALLGHIVIRTSKQNMVFPPASSWVVTSKDESWGSGSQGSKTLSIMIVWHLKDGIVDESVFVQYNIYVENTAKKAVEVSSQPTGVSEEYLGVARVQAFYVSDLVVPSGVSSLKFTIQVCGIDGSIQKLEESPKLLLNVEGV